MIYLILCILCCSSINIIFKIASQRGLNSFPIILVNYLFASITGFLISDLKQGMNDFLGSGWIILIMVMGILFIIVFFMISESVIKTGISKTAIATRMSMVIPVTFSMFYFTENINLIKITGIITALAALYLTLFKKEKNKTDKFTFILPLLIFLGAGIIDSLIKFSQEIFVTDNNLSLFSSLLFFIAGLTGLTFFIIKKTSFILFRNIEIWIFGGILGVANFGTVLFMVKALNESGLDSSVVFGVNHIGIVTFTVLTAWILFKEKLSIVNWTGVVLAIASILILIK